MAIIQETFYIDNREFTRTYSNAGRYVVREGAEYVEACDPAEYNRQYIEGGIIEDDEPSTAEEIVNILTGGAEE